MDPNLPPANTLPQQPPKDLKAQVTEQTNEFVKNNYESFLRRLVGVIYSILKFLKTNITIMINMALGRE